jgi:ribosomal-protein-alanine N-acetyltransferase
MGTTEQSAPVRLRWLQRRDIGCVFRIGATWSSLGASADEFVDCVESMHSAGIVAEAQGCVVGFVIYQLQRAFSEVIIKNIVVMPVWRRHGIGRGLLNLVKSKLDAGYDRLIAIAPESNVVAQLFLRQEGFTAVRILADYFQTDGGLIMSCESPEVVQTPAADCCIS